ncbi:MAG TPA: OmpH family outer membrane protein [Ignavibacteria bacterium]|nr:OmpH family outer membrane protein [Ignavibacteria bacterium]
MKNYFIKTFIICAVIMFSGFANESNAQLKIGFVDSQVILEQLPEAKKVTADLEEYRNKFLDTLRAMAIEFKEKDSIFAVEYQAAQQQVESGAITSNDDLKALNDKMNTMRMEIVQMEDQLKNYDQYVQNAVYEKRQELSKPLYDKINKAIEDLAKEMKYSYIFDKAAGNPLYGDKEFDVTFKVMDKLK